MIKFKKVHADFETRSKVDLVVHGTDRYSKDPSTEVTVLVYGFDDEPLKTWRPGDPNPRDLMDHLAFGGQFWAHNVNFEFQIWNNVCVSKYGFTPLKLEQCYCTMSMANAMGLMGSLDGAAQGASLEVRKDQVGYRTMMMLCKPKSDGTYWERDQVPEKFQTLEDYCAQDVIVERALSKRLAPLSEAERNIWLTDQKINYRGFSIDVKSAKRLDAMVDLERERLLKEFSVITANQVPTPASHVKFKQWLKDQGVEVDSIAKDVVTKLLSDDDEDDSILGELTLPPHVRQAFLIRREASKSSNAKIKMMLNLECNGRIRNGIEYYGAKQTGRFAGRKLQPHNFPRGKLKDKDIEDVMKRLNHPNGMDEISMIHGDIMTVASSCIRSLIVPKPENRLVVADWSNIEGRGLAWLAGEEWKLQAFRNFDFDPIANPDIYKLAYSKSFNVSVLSVNPDQRQIGKTMELAFGYQGAVGAFQVMAKTLGVKMSDVKAKELTDLWRAAHPRIKKYWYEVEEAAVNAITTPGVVFSVGTGARKIIYVKKGSFLCCKLPSGRVMYYPYPKYEEVDAPWGGKKMSITYMYQESDPKKKTKGWVRGPTYGGSLVENLCQAICRDILVEGILRVEANGYGVVLHVHDEIVCEVPIGSKHSVKELEELMAVVPTWATGFPIVAKGFESLRYKKG